MKTDENKSMALIRPKQPFVDWVNSLVDDVSDDLGLAKVQADSSGYFIPPYETPTDAMNYLMRHAKEILERELSDWTVDEDEWPDNRDFNVLCDWFEIILCDSIFELEHEPEKPELN
jgi:hypothetical protein